MEKPNVLFILIDDLGWKDLSCTGSEFYETPNIDKIAEQGTKFTRAYASCPVCSPTRASLMTGKYPARVGITQWIGGKTIGKMISAPYLHYLPLEEKSLATTFKEAGYNTYHVGKWHLGGEDYYPENHGFDVNIGGCHWGHPWYGYFSPYKNPKLIDGPKGEYLTDRLTEEAIKLLKNNKNKPFFMHLSYYSVHTPIQAPEKEIEYFKEKVKKLGLDKKKAFIFDKVDFSLEEFHIDKIKRRIIQSDPVYAAMIKRLDTNIGKILNTLNEIGIEENTIVIFYSDNGGLCDSSFAPTSNLPLRLGKSHLYEGGLRVPFLIKWPKKIEPRNEISYPITTPDIYPTLLDLCNIPLIPEQHVDGKSFKKILLMNNKTYTKDNMEKIEQKRDPIFWHYPHYNGNAAYPGSVIIEGNWKLIQWHEELSYELFNLKDDPGEKNDLSKNFPDIVKKLSKKLENWKIEVKSKMPKKNPYFQLIKAKTKIRLSGTLEYKEIEELNNIKDVILNCKISEYNSEPMDVPLMDILEDFTDIDCLLKINSDIYTGRFIFNKKFVNNDRGKVNKIECIGFIDTHKEQMFELYSLVKDLIGKKVSLKGWKDFPNELDNGKKVIPQIEIKLIDKINDSESS